MNKKMIFIKFRFSRFLIAHALCIILIQLLDSPLQAKTLPEKTTTLTTDRLSKEYKIKAAYILNMILYISWPEERKNKNSKNIEICVDQNKAFSSFLKATLKSKKSHPKMKNVSIRELKLQNNIRTCDIYYKIKFAKHTPKIQCDCILIGDNTTHRSFGTSINFYKSKKHIRFEINLEKTKKLNIKISSELLKLARVFKTTQ